MAPACRLHRTSMLVYILVLCFCASLASKLDYSVNNQHPCMYSDKIHAYKDFLSKHVRADAPTTLDQNKWQAFIQNIGTCNRPIQSFLPFTQKQEVDNVCSASGGKVYSGNLCISRQEFTFTTVYVDNNCILRKVISERKYIILACDELQGYCRPVHFEANPGNVGPNPLWLDCKQPKVQSFEEFACPAMGLLIITVLSAAFICSKCLTKSKKKNEENKK
ncbi:uncharacterized protein LOC113570681 [Electrophorus electricus]|uniref:uncharacterized protein LOC113570681 n=1 Tax=Electrophorus electricus TaxID=8005 RepID=UPI0015D02E06|nr:uncharacterized protein LOC113570681 [Electrophorus electricus]